MGATVSQLNNKVSFDVEEYIRERQELAGLLRDITEAACTHRQQKGTMMVINGASGVAASVVGVVAMATAPVTFGLTTPVAIVGHSLAAASLASSAASYGYGHAVDKDVALRLQNLQYVVESIAKKDEEVNVVLRKNKQAIPTPPKKNESTKDQQVTIQKDKKSESQRDGEIKGKPEKEGKEKTIEKTLDKEVIQEESKKKKTKTEKQVEGKPKKTKTENSTTNNGKKVPVNNSQESSKSGSTELKTELAKADTVPQKGSAKVDSLQPESNKEKISQKKKQYLQLEACSRLQEILIALDIATSEKSVARDLPVSVLSSQGLVFGTKSIVQGARQIQTEEALEEALGYTADAMDVETKLVNKCKDSFRYATCLPVEMTELPRGRLTYIDGGGGCSRTMVVNLLDATNNKTLKMESDSSNVILLPVGATNIKVHFTVKGGTTVKKVDRSDPKQPWVKSTSAVYATDEFDFDVGDGVDAVFVVQGSITHSYVTKAWDFGRHSAVAPRSWEFWENAHEECKELVPEMEARKKRRYQQEPWSISHCGACFGQDAKILDSVA